MVENVVFNADCLEAMRKMPDKCFDLAVVDPPYFSGPEKCSYFGAETSKIGVKRERFVEPTWDVPGEEYFKELVRVSKNYIVWGCNYFDFRFATGRIVWDKCNTSGTFSNCEIAATNIHDSVRLFRFMWNGMLQGKSIAEGYVAQGNKRKNEIRIHPTQKPVALYAWIFQNYASPGDRVLDTHLGSGSSRIAAYNAGLSFIGFEINSYYCAKQEERFAAHTNQLSLFA